jgi:hypothetical protein
MSTQKERPKLDKSDDRMLQLVIVAHNAQVVSVGLEFHLVRMMLVFPDQTHNYIQLGKDLRQDKMVSATDYNVKKAFRYLTEHGVVEAGYAGTYKLTSEFIEFNIEVLSKNAQNRQKRK